jgi:Domain of unknown function (DUF4833)
MSFLDKPGPDPGPSFVSEVKKRGPNVFLIFFRNKNKNAVIYEANVVDGKINKNKPVEIYWLDVDPKYRESTRSKGIMHDRIELTSFENTFVYGLNVEIISDVELQITFKADSSTPMRVKISPKSSSLYVVKDGTTYMIRSAYVAATENINLIRLRDNVSELTFHVVNMTTKVASDYRVK